MLVQEMVGGARELIAGMVRDSVFGPCVMVGLGGVFSEALADRSFRAAPVSKDEALDMLAELKGAPFSVLSGGCPPAISTASPMSS